MTVPLFRFREVTVEFDGRTVLDGIDLELSDNGITAIVGPSGSGKSTLLRLCNRLVVPARGRVELRGTDIATLDVLAYRRRVGMVFQRPTMFPGTVRDNLRVADPDASEDRLAGVLDRVALSPSYLARTGDELSGGEAQRACLARTLLCDPEVLLADEPTSALDPGTTAALERLARTLAAGGVPVLWVTHDLEQADRLADHRVVLVGGHVADPAEAERYAESWRAGLEDDDPSAPPEGTDEQGGAERRHG